MTLNWKDNYWIRPDQGKWVEVARSTSGAFQYINFFKKGTKKALRVEKVAGKWQVVTGEQVSENTILVECAIFTAFSREDAITYALDYMDEN